MKSNATSCQYLKILEQEFADRKRRNPLFSYRQFSRLLGVSSGRLSLIMRGKEGLSREMAQKFATSLGMNEKRSEYFCDLVESVHSRSASGREQAKKRLAESADSFEIVDLDTFSLISEWYHQAILELTMVKGFKSDSAWIAKALGISKVEALGAIERLCRTGELRWIDGELKVASANTRTPTDIPSKAIKNLHYGILKKGIEAIDDQNVHQRDFSCMIFALDSSKIGIAKERIKKFRRGLVNELQSNDTDADQVTCLSIQMFGLSKVVS